MGFNCGLCLIMIKNIKLEEVGRTHVSINFVKGLIHVILKYGVGDDTGKFLKHLVLYCMQKVQHRYDIDALPGVHGATVLADGTTAMSTTKQINVGSRYGKAQVSEGIFPDILGCSYPGMFTVTSQDICCYPVRKCTGLERIFPDAKMFIPWDLHFDIQDIRCCYPMMVKPSNRG
ncbi:hypothetical protein Cgig2_010648 [Carnegiea gigantea]|uniref:Uncharacterized protein n=1 Tax=Carnegiea gigantea TaxID=171969 RepID=A0A9Q1Q5L6_9CARY|nr:hypothetical protein Cgig2_010648 [Carnegiea gigantea]